MKKKEKPISHVEKSCRLGTVGGQAVIEGVMMKSKDRYAVTVRLEDGTFRTVEKPFRSVRSKHKLLNLPILRGIVNFAEMMILSFRTLSVSADAYATVEDSATGEKRSLGKATLAGIMTVASILGVALALVLFKFLPMLAAKGLDSLWGRLFSTGLGFGFEIAEGVVKILLFVGYLLVVSLMKDIRRTFEFHGAEHKTIFCYEAGEELTPENVKKYTRFHPRCGTSFLFVLLIVGILLSYLPFVRALRGQLGLRLLVQLGMMFPIIGIGFEFIMLAGKHPNPVTRMLSAPGLWMQRITTKEPDAEQITCAIRSLQYALREQFPEKVAAYEAEQAAYEAAEAAKKQPTEAEPAEAQPAEADTAEAEPVEAQPAEVKPAEADTAEAKPAEADTSEDLQP